MMQEMQELIPKMNDTLSRMRVANQEQAAQMMQGNEYFQGFLDFRPDVELLSVRISAWVYLADTGHEAWRQARLLSTAEAAASGEAMGAASAPVGLMKISETALGGADAKSKAEQANEHSALALQKSYQVTYAEGVAPVISFSLLSVVI
eukprot:CAMPEP_0183344326 /NCGR_PEP_ID=MMETSP0164_2-20130417/10038_1 /TAXON_ID=221442 /ORGANISM="Coccolithus pelagicus ssp braarudi, Strain PLY182g" /LENGTH=148 /DNA_ID=CAMNT_0025515313 /DNA_START=72 /DNA_END=517 /DNA_ORIENTATION=-